MLFAGYDLDVNHCKLIQENYMYLLERLDVKYSLLVTLLFDNEVRTALFNLTHTFILQVVQ